MKTSATMDAPGRATCCSHQRAKRGKGRDSFSDCGSGVSSTTGEIPEKPAVLINNISDHQVPGAYDQVLKGEIYLSIRNDIENCTSNFCAAGKPWSVHAPSPRERGAGWGEAPSSGHIDHDDLGIVERGDGHDALVFNRRAVAFGEPHAIDLDRTACRHEIAAPALGQTVFGRLAGFQGRAQHPCIGPDRQRVAVSVKAAGERHEMAGAVAFREWPGVPP